MAKHAVKNEAFPMLRTYIQGYGDVVTVLFSTNSGDVGSSEGFMQLRQAFQYWGGWFKLGVGDKNRQLHGYAFFSAG